MKKVPWNVKPMHILIYAYAFYDGNAPFFRSVVVIKLYYNLYEVHSAYLPTKTARKNILRGTKSCKPKIWALEHDNKLLLIFRLHFRVIVYKFTVIFRLYFEVSPQTCCRVLKLKPAIASNDQYIVNRTRHETINKSLSVFIKYWML